MTTFRYTAELIDKEDRQSYWAVVEWNQNPGPFRTGNLIERCHNQRDAEATANAYNLIHAFAN